MKSSASASASTRAASSRSNSKSNGKRAGARAAKTTRDAAGPPRFVNRIPSRKTIRKTGATRLDIITLTRVHTFDPALDVLSFFDGRGILSVLGGRPFAPRVAIAHDHLPGRGQLSLDCDYQARLARASQLAFSLPTPKRHSRSDNVGGGFPGVAFALLYSSCSSRSQRGEWMRTPAVSSLDTVSLAEALAYLDASEGDELGAAFALATDRNMLDGSSEAPDDAEVHHALFLLRKARGLDAPSFDLMRVQLKRRVAA
jgi:hypothetical protein